MHLEALSIFCDVVRHQSFSRGATAHSVSQSAASQAVRQIERRLGARLIDRSTRPWRLTTEGKLFFKGCQEIVERYQNLETEVRQLQRPQPYTVKLATIYSVRLHDLSEYVTRFQREVPGGDVSVEYMHPDEVYARVLADQCDIGLISFANPRRDLTVVPWEDQPMVIACRPGHRLTNGNHVSGIVPRELSGEPFIAFDRGLPVRRETDRFLRRHGAEVKVVAEFDNIENIKQAVEDGDGVAILPEPTLGREVNARTLVTLRFRTTPDLAPLNRPMSIIHRRKRHLNPSVAQFIALLRAGRAEPMDRATPTTTIEAGS